MLPWSADLAGRIDEQVITSELLLLRLAAHPSGRPLATAETGMTRPSRPRRTGGC
jgi:hypothetical protein